MIEPQRTLTVSPDRGPTDGPGGPTATFPRHTKRVSTSLRSPLARAVLPVLGGVVVLALIGEGLDSPSRVPS